MRKAGIFVLAICSLMMALDFAASAQEVALKPRPAASSPSPLAAKMDAYLSGIYKPGNPGAAVLVKAGGKTILRKGYGMADLELGVPVEPNMIFRLGSITKQFTAVGILMLAEQGKLALTDDLSKFLPDYPLRGRTITIEQLLTHTSGIKSYTDLEEWLPLLRKDMTVAEIISLFKDKPDEFAPGERWLYCNSGYILLGAVIEKVSGMSYRDFVEKKIFEPLGMKRSYYDVTNRVIPGRVPGYQMGNAGFENAPYLSMTQPYAAGSLMSTVDDLALWAESLLSGRLVKRETVERAWMPHVLKNGRSTGYGYGWFKSMYKGHRFIEHGGGVHGFITAMLFAPEDGVFVAILTNGIGGGRDPEAEAFRLATIALGDPYVDPAPVPLPQKDLDRLVGVYINDQGVERYIIREGERFVSQRKGSGKFILQPLSPTEFFFKDSLSRVVFRQNADGSIAGLEVSERIGPVDVYARKEKPLPAARREITLDPALLDRLVGEYAITPEFTIIVTKENGRLMALATGQQKVELFPESETAFFLKIVDAQVVFTLDAAGKAVSLTLTQGGQVLPAKKIK
ncbi:MAG: serine hydrolase [Candidatus Aminicenantes bacterium]|nr:serine hydrolase [Candidatus Aminicenantes bacterium]